MIKLIFVGTKGEIEEENPLHKFNSSLLIVSSEYRLLIDYGEKSPDLKILNPDTILITHGHPDHFTWLKNNIDYDKKIYVSLSTLQLAKYPKNFVLFKENSFFEIGPFKVLAYPVIHSIRAPAVGFKLFTPEGTFIYNPDIVVMENKRVLENVNLYIGDGSSFKTNLVRKKGNQLFGHAQIKTQINWCKEYKIKKAIFTHLGREVIFLQKEDLEKQLSDSEIEVKIAYDGFQEILIKSPPNNFYQFPTQEQLFHPKEL